LLQSNFIIYNRGKDSRDLSPVKLTILRIFVFTTVKKGFMYDQFNSLLVPIPCGSPRVVIPVPHQVRDKLQPESRNINWMPVADPVLGGDQVRHDI